MLESTAVGRRRFGHATGLNVANLVQKVVEIMADESRHRGRSLRLGRWTLVAGLIATSASAAIRQDPSAGRTTPPSSSAGSAPAAGAVGPAVPSTTTVTVPVAPSNTEVAPVVPGSTTAVPVTPGATTVVPVAPGTTEVKIQDPSAVDPRKPGATITVPIPAADPAKPGAGVIVPIPGADPTKPGGTITIVPDATKPPVDPSKPKDTDAPTIQPELTAPATETITVPTNDPTATGAAPGAAVADAKKPRVRTSVTQAAKDSLFGRTDYATWEPLKFSTLLTQGWDEAWIGPPNGAKGGPRQGWIGAADGNFYRLGFFSFDYTRAVRTGGDGYAGGFTLYTPLSRRLLLITQIPFVDSNLPSLTIGKQQFAGTGAGTGTGTSHGHPARFGDLGLTTRVMLFEKENFSWIAELTVQIPTGSHRSSGGLAEVTPGTQFWWNFAERWVIRGGFNQAIGTNRAAGGTTLVSQLAIGRTFTPHDVPIFGDFTVYLASNTFSNVSTGSTESTLGPGFRTHLGNSFYFLGATTIPVTGPRPYEESATFWIMKVY